MEEIKLDEKPKGLIIPLINELKNKIKDPNIDTSSALKIISVGMEIVETYKTKENKKDLVISTMKELIKDNNDLITDDIKGILNPIIENDMIISNIIDVICDATKGNLKINNIKTKCCFFNY
jgi:hypothetical protein